MIFWLEQFKKNMYICLFYLNFSIFMDNFKWILMFVIWWNIHDCFKNCLIKKIKPNELYQISNNIKYRLKYQIFIKKYQISNIKYQISNIKYQISISNINIKYQISKYQISNIKYQIKYRKLFKYLLDHDS
jgi:hypothetical protein